MNVSKVTLSRRSFVGGMLAWGAVGPGFGAGLAGKPNLVVGIVSDPHANSRPNNAFLRKAFELFRARGVDAVAIPGDFGFVAKHGELLMSSRTWFDVFPDDRLPDGRKVERLFITGNHDEDGWLYGKKAKERYKDTTVEEAAFAFHRQEYWREAWHEDYSPVFAKAVKGYTFVCRHWLPRQSYKDNPAVAWLKAHEAELPAERPFFYLQHETLTGATNHPSAGKVVGRRLWDGADDGAVAKILAGHPNCVALTGHLHNPLTFDTGIWQGTFTSVDCASANAWAFTWPGRENGHPGGKEMPMCDVADQRHCLVMSVYDDRIVFERRCLLKDESLGADWVVPIGSQAKRPYTIDAKNAAEPPPEFAPGSKVEVRCEMGEDVKGDRHEQLVVSFPCVNGSAAPFVRAFDYEIVSPQAKRTYVVFSPNCCLAPRRDAGPVVCRLNAADFPKDAPLTFEVRPRDSRGRTGKPILVTFDS